MTSEKEARSEVSLEVRLAEGEADAIAAFKAYQQMHAEGCVPGAFDPLKTLTNVLRFIKGPGSVVLLAMDGDTLAGVLTLAESSYWYNQTDKWLCDKGLYVLPEHRNGEAFALLLDAAKSISDDTGLAVFIFINNGNRKRGGRSPWERVGLTLGYENRGAILAHSPEK